MAHEKMEAVPPFLLSSTPARIAMFSRRCPVYGQISFVVGFLSILLCAETVVADVQVHTNDGRVLTGEVDARTSADRLWIRQETDQIVLVTSVDWSTVVSAHVDGETINAKALADRASQLATERSFGFLSEPTDSELRAKIEQHASAPKADSWRGAPLRSRITSLEIDAVLVNLDRDVEPDGFELAIAAVDATGRSVPVKGNLTIRLMGERNEHHSGRIRFEDMQQWTRPVAPEDFVDGVAGYVLPFRAVHPEFDFELRPDAQLNVRLGVFGSGNFAATVPVLLREFNPFRDRMQMFEGSRFFRDELSRRVRHLGDDSHGIFRP